VSMGRRQPPPPPDEWVAAADLPCSPGHPFYDRLNRLLAEHGFDAYAEGLCRPYYADGQGRPGIPPGVYFRMLFVGFTKRRSRSAMAAPIIESPAAS